ncbi:unnamed protein product [Durusdinium trenchii]|uniref:Uncharacterized protein n=1 Tax=Durusdinium trenchii TaxID=1381693 RepID=A0ABP0PUL9_9DINO
MSPKMLKLVINKSPNGHKKAKYKQTIIEYNWRIDYYPPKEGGLEAIMKLNVPMQVSLSME